ncbi:unnamed protein product, partial [Allacma fusca]
SQVSRKFILRIEEVGKGRSELKFEGRQDEK